MAAVYASPEARMPTSLHLTSTSTSPALFRRANFFLTPRTTSSFHSHTHSPYELLYTTCTLQRTHTKLKTPARRAATNVRSARRAANTPSKLISTPQQLRCPRFRFQRATSLGFDQTSESNTAVQQWHQPKARKMARESARQGFST
jgi:hypothetical protein